MKKRDKDRMILQLKTLERVIGDVRGSLKLLETSHIDVDRESLEGELVILIGKKERLEKEIINIEESSE